MPSSADPEKQAFVTPRALVLFSTAYKKIHEMYNKAVESGQEPDADYYLEITETTAAQYCGRPWAVAFATFIRDMALFDLDDLAYKIETKNSIQDIAADPKTGAVNISVVNTYNGFLGRALVYNLRPDVRYTPEGIKNLVNISKIMPKFTNEGAEQVFTKLKLSFPKFGNVGGKDVASGYEFVVRFLQTEEQRYNALTSAASQLKMGNEAQIDAFIKGMYANAKLDAREMDNVLDTFKNLLSRNKGNGAKSFEDLNTIVPGVVPANACQAILKTFEEKLGPAAGKSKQRSQRSSKTKFGTFG